MKIYLAPPYHLCAPFLSTPATGPLNPLSSPAFHPCTSSQSLALPLSSTSPTKPRDGEHVDNGAKTTPHEKTGGDTMGHTGAGGMLGRGSAGHCEDRGMTPKAGSELSVPQAQRLCQRLGNSPTANQQPPHLLLSGPKSTCTPAL